MRATFSIVRAFAAVAVCAVAVSSALSGRAHADPPQSAPPKSSGPSRAAQEAAYSISALDYDDARAALARGDASELALQVESARLAVYEGRCDDALITLGTPELLKTEGGAGLFDIARGCSRVTAATLADTDEAHSVVVRYQDEADRVMTPLIVETEVAAREALTRDLGVTWPLPTRVTVVRDLMSLSAMTGLPQKSAQTTGTVAVAKWGRVTLLSPRASEHGFPWRDTLAHELTHLAVTRASADRAPLWLQEGMAKREEIRWRPPGPFDDRPSPDAVVLRGFEKQLGIALDELGPSIAMLPSADAAMVAFAEVTSFVRYLADAGGPDALPKLLLALRHGFEVDAALSASTGADLHTWDGKWRGYLATQPKAGLPDMFGLLGDADGGNLRDLRDRVRLAQLLYGRTHSAAALAELSKIATDKGKNDPSIRSLRAHVLEALGRRADARAQVSDPLGVSSTFGPWWAIRGILARGDGEGSVADEAFVEAVATDPFDVEAACEVLETLPAPTDDWGPETAAKALCAGARARQEPPLGRD